MQRPSQKFAIACLSSSLALVSPLLGQTSLLSALGMVPAAIAQSSPVPATQSLTEGATGATVEAIQQQLKNKGFDPGPIDGFFGDKTKTALIAFQKSKGLRADGVAGAQTLAALGVKPAPVATTKTSKPAKAATTPTPAPKTTATPVVKKPTATPTPAAKPAATSTSAAKPAATPTPAAKPAATQPAKPAPATKPAASTTAQTPAATPQQPAAPVVVADKYYWPGSEGNLGLQITGKFISLEKEAASFDLLQEVGQFRGRQWKLGDILVSVNFNANGNVATWKVSGPKPLITEYIDGLRKRYEDKSLFADFSFTYVNFKPTAALE